MLPKTNKNARIIIAATSALVAAGMVTAAASQAVNIGTDASVASSVAQTSRPVPSSTNAPAPTTSRPANKPTTSKPAPTTSRPAPSTSKPAPTKTTAKPVPTTGKPTPGPVDQVPAFTEHTMTAGRYLKQNHGLKSKNKKYAAALQVDGNFTVFEAATLKFVWGAGTNGKGGTILKLQEDGNLVILNAANKIVWQTDTALEKGGEKSALTIEDDGDIVLYQGDNKEIAWHSDSAQD